MAATVLLVEDERKLRELVRSYLERAGFTVLSTGSGAEAATVIASAPEPVDSTVNPARSRYDRTSSRSLRSSSTSSTVAAIAAHRPSLGLPAYRLAAAFRTVLIVVQTGRHGPGRTSTHRVRSSYPFTDQMTAPT